MTDAIPLSLGTKTKWGRVDMIGSLQGERYYWMTDKSGVVSVMPADVVEPSVRVNSVVQAAMRVAGEGSA